MSKKNINLEISRYDFQLNQQFIDQLILLS